MLDEALLVAGLVLVLDQASKAFVTRLGVRPRCPAGYKFGIRPVKHSSVALGFVSDQRLLILLWCVAVIGTSVLIWYVTSFQGRAAYLGLGAAIGGATGNLLDILWRGAVVDFIDLRIGPVFNIADAAIVLGVIVALWSAAWSAQ
jgi:signal peptidase II